MFKRIRTDHPARFLTTFAAALLANITKAYESIIDHQQLTPLHGLIINFVASYLKMVDRNTDKGEEIVPLLEGVITTYVPIYLSNQMLFWSGQYWEESHPVLSRRVKSKDLVNIDLDNSLRYIYVYSLVGEADLRNWLANLDYDRMITINIF